MTAAQPEHIAIVGGGFAGTLLAINLMRYSGMRVTLIERSAGRMARGVAYGTARAEHVLNVRAANMSAFPDDPGHFVRWLEAHGGGDRASFVPRARYGAYLRDLLDATRAASADRLRLIAGDVRAVDRRDRDYRLVLANAAALSADAVVLALGNLPPHAPAGIDPDCLPAGCYAADPWTSDLHAGLGTGDTVVLLGTGLTAVDAALSLDAAGFAGRIVAISRRGLAPRRHVDVPPVPGLKEKPAATLSALVRHMRRRAATVDWRVAVDELRPMTQMMWRGADAVTRARFLRHLRPWWDVHRHRLAPVVADRIDRLVAQGRLGFHAGKLIDVAPVGKDRVQMRWQPRGAGGASDLIAARIVNCTGPQGDLTRSAEPLLRQLVATGSIRPDTLHIGLDVDASAQVVGADGCVVDGLFCIGPMTRGASWEVVAVPDIRQQCWALARKLSNAHWVEAEGL